MSLKEIDFSIRGLTPLIVHNSQLSDPLNPFTKALKAITSKKKKTDEDHEACSHAEFMGGLYVDENEAPCIPGENLERMLRDAAAKDRRGKDTLAGLFVDGNVPIEYEGPKKPEKLWKDSRFVFRASAAVMGKRVIRTRPIFRAWALSFTVTYDDEVFNAEDIVKFMNTAGRLIGVGAWRPKYGRFEVL
jgi:hypothetical protein